MTKKVWRPSLEAEQSIQQFTKDLLASLPRKIGAPELIPGCEVIALDPFATGVFPRDITVRINEYYQFVTWRGSPSLAVGDSVMVAHIREGDLYEVIGISGSGGSSSPASMLLGVWVYDVSLSLLVEYATINGALGYGALASGDYILIGPGTYDESITLVNGVLICEMVPGTVIINSTAANTAVTTAQGGYIQVKEIRVTRANNNINAVLASHAAGDCTIYTELIRAQNAGTGDSIGLNQTGAGNLYVYASDVQASGGDGSTYGATATAGVQVIYGNCLAENGTGSDSVGANCDNATQTVYGDCVATDDDRVYGALCGGGGSQIIRGHCTATGAAGASDAYGASCFNTGSVQVVFGNCTAEAVDVAIGADRYQSTETIHGDCSGTSSGGASTSYGARSRHDGSQTVWGNCTATGGTTSIGAYNQTWAGTPSQRVNGDVTGDFYGAQCEVGTQTITNGRASGATADLRRTGGTLQAFSVQHDTIAGTISWLDGDALESLRDYAQGNVIIGGAADWEALGIGAPGQVLTVNPAGTQPIWAAGGGGGGVYAHYLMSTTHTDTRAQNVYLGELIYGGPALWETLPIGTAGQVLTVDTAGQRPVWAAPTGGVYAHYLLSTVHIDTNPQGVYLGDMIYGGPTLWETIPIGDAGDILHVDAAGQRPEWEAPTGIGLWEPLTDGDQINPELVFTYLADVIMVWIP